MHKQSLAIILLALCGCGSTDNVLTGSPSPQPGPTMPSSCAVDASEQEMLKLVNDARTTARACGGTQFAAAPALGWNCQLHQAAQKHAEDMANNGFLDHSGSDGLGPGERVTAAGYSWRAFGENIAGGPDDAASAVDGWLTSPGHCSNIMDPAFSELGMDSAFNPSSRFGRYWTQVFAAPR